MPGKVNPVMCECLMQVAARVIGNDQTVTISGAAGGNFQLNIMMHVMGHTVLESIHLMANGVQAFIEFCMDGLGGQSSGVRSGGREESVDGYQPLSADWLRKKAANWLRSFRYGPKLFDNCAKTMEFAQDTLREALDPFA